MWCIIYLTPSGEAGNFGPRVGAEVIDRLAQDGPGNGFLVKPVFRYPA